MDEAEEQGFYTLKGYRLLNEEAVTEAMEDYLEMICRCTQEAGGARVRQLADKLHVRPSSASKMAVKLRELGLLNFERYGKIVPTEAGWQAGRYLLWRHALLHRFFCLLNRSDNQLRQVEQVEHYMSRETMLHLQTLVEQWESGR